MASPEEGSTAVSVHAISPLRVVCLTCGAQRDMRCTQPTNTGRRAVDWFHLTREDEAEEQSRQVNDQSQVGTGEE